MEAERRRLQLGHKYPVAPRSKHCLSLLEVVAAPPSSPSFLFPSFLHLIHFTTIHLSPLDDSIMTRWSLRALCVASTLLALLCQWRTRAYLVNPWTAREWASGFFTNKCHPIPKNMTLCYGIGYDQMRLPNLLNHESVDEAVQQSNIWNLLDKTKCHDDLRIFLCSLYAPVCLKEARDRQIIKPCRSLCRVVRDNCLPRMQRFGYEWPAIARCDKFPDEKRNNLCIPPREQQQKTVATCRACDQAITFENIISSYCMADVVLKGKMKSHRVDPSEYLFNIHKKRRYFRKIGLSSGDKRNIGGQLKRSNGCVCPQLAKARRHDKWLIMGRRDRTTGRIDIVFLTAWQRRNRPFKKATRAIRKQSNICRRQQYSFMTNNDISLSQRPVSRGRQKGGGRRRQQQQQEVDDRFKYVDRQEPTRDSLQLLEGPTQWAPPRLSGRRNDLLARHMQELGPAVKPLVRPRQLPLPVRQPDPPPPPQRPTLPQAPQRPPAVQRPTQSLTPTSEMPIRPLQPTMTNQQPTALSQPVGPTQPEPTRTNKRRGKNRRNRKNRKKNREGKKRDGKKRRKKQRGQRRKGRKKKERKKDAAKGQSDAERERKRKRKRKKLRQNYLRQYYGVALAR